MNIRLTETAERSGAAIHKITGTTDFGEFGETQYEIYDKSLIIGGGYVQLDVNAQDPSLRYKSRLSGVQIFAHS